MGSTAKWVRQALADLGADAPDQAVKAYIREKDASVPEGQIALTLRRLRGKVVPTMRRQSHVKPPPAKPSQGELFAAE
jgi:hypothetical protein